MEKDITPEMVERFFSNGSDAQEAEMVNAYLQEHPEVLEEFIKKEDFFEQDCSEGMPVSIKDNIWQQIENHAGIPPMAEKRNITALKRLRMVAASLILLIGAGYLSYLQFTKKPMNDLVIQQDKAIEKIIENTTKEDIKAELPDGSQLVLKSGTVISYYNDFQKSRNVYLNGIAFFKVAKDKTRPFTVFSKGIGTTALGTQFWVIGKPEKKSLIVKLLEGKVVVQSNEKKFEMKKVYLTPNQMVTINKMTGVVSISNIEPLPEKMKVPQVYGRKTPSMGHTIWSTGSINFSKTPLEQVFRKMEDKFHVKITFKQEDLDNGSFTGEFMNSDSLDVLLKAICDMNGLSYKVENKHIVIRKK